MINNLREAFRDILKKFNLIFFLTKSNETDVKINVTNNGRLLRVNKLTEIFFSL